MSDTYKVGSYCRILASTPARYLGHGMGLGVCAQDNELLCGDAHGFEDPVNLPYPDDHEVYSAAAVVRACWKSFEVERKKTDRRIVALEEQVAELLEAIGSALWNLGEGADVGAAMESLAAVLPEEAS